VTHRLRGIANVGSDEQRIYQRELLTEQLTVLNRLNGTRFIGNLLGVIVIQNSIGAAVPYLLYWGVVFLLVLAREMRSRGVSRDPAPDPVALGQASRNAVVYNLAYGALWGLLVAVVYPVTTPDHKLLIAIFATGMLCASPFLLAVRASAVYAFCVPLLTGAIYAVCVDGMADNLVFLAAIGVYTIALPIGVGNLAHSFATSVVSRCRVKEQKHLIGLLLHDFETNSDDWLWQTDGDLLVKPISEKAAASASHDGAVLVGSNLPDFLRANASPSDLGLAHRLIRLTSERKAFRDVHIRLFLNGSDRWWSMTGTPSYDSNGNFAGYRGIGRDITAQKKSERELMYLAHHDSLTGASNRACFNQVLDEAIDRACDMDERFALIVLDLDDFKGVNDVFGHQAGDTLLCSVVQRLEAGLPDARVIARMGGDEFAVIISLNERHDNAFVQDEVSRAILRISDPIQVKDHSFSVSASAGIAIIPEHSMDAIEAYNLADSALYCAKTTGKNVVVLADPDRDADQSKTRELETDLNRAIENSELSLMFQPIVSAADERTVAFEALARWNHPRFGRIDPSAFIGMAERLGSIHKIGRWVLQQACATATTWPEHIRLSVNVSPRQFERGELVNVLTETLEASGLAPHRLEIEITESVFLGDVINVRTAVAEMRAKGITVAMDDFGAGYSSLSALQEAQFDKLKIDQSLVRKQGSHSASTAILRSVIAIGQALDLLVIAEGIETRAQADLLRDLGADCFQGYLFHKPMVADDIGSFLLKETARALQSEVTDYSAEILRRARTG
jgi:diguanylate cyclase (GGDEF)-like protein